MYQYSYADILADAAEDSRMRERQALDQADALLRHAAEGPAGSAEEQKAVAFTAELWGLFVGDLAQPGNAMPDGLRASLMSVGLGVLAECRRIAAGESRDLAGIADICAIVRDGLR